MKKLFVLTFIFVLTGCGTLDDHPAKMNELMSSGQCYEAEKYANSTFRDDYLDWMMGNVALKCRRDKKKAINYYSVAADRKLTHLRGMC